MSDLTQAMADIAEKTERTLKNLLPSPDGPEAQVLEAMRYAALAGGKRLRPFLAVQSGRLFDVDDQNMLRIGAALECVHTYSLVHDDLPCMDDDDLRRGKPTTHLEYDEATAVLAGDALLTIAFEILSNEATHSDPYIRCKLVSHLASASGGQGMVGGQMIDLLAENEPDLDIGTITRLQRMKTGALFVFACEAGAIAGRASDRALGSLNAYAHDLGLAFQITDDLLDSEGTAEALGKTPGKDEEAGKATFVTILGKERAKSQARLLANQAVAHLDSFDERADFLRAVAEFVVERDR